MKIGDLCTYAPKSSIKAGEAVSNGKYMFFTSSADENKRYSDYQLDCEAIIMGTGGNATLHYYNGKFSTSTDCVVLVPNSSVRCKYLYYFFLCNMVVLENGFKGAGLKHTNKNYISNIEIYNVPNIETQDKIIKVLDVVCGIRFYYQQQLQKLDELVKARFAEIFGKRGKAVPLTDYVWFQEGPGVRSVDFTEEGTILLTGSNINDNKLSFGYKSDRFISNKLANDRYAHFMCDKGDILVVSSAIAPEKFDKKVVTVKEDKKYCLNTGIIRFKPNQNVMTFGYFREFLKTDYFKHQVMAEMRGIAQMHFGPSHLKQMTIILPDSMEEQIEYDDFVEQTDKSKFAIQQALDKAQILLDSLMQKYFG